ncbi:unnamed protein product, partial [Porites evermanni]
MNPPIQHYTYPDNHAPAAAYDRILQFLYPGQSPSVTANTRFLEEDVVLSGCHVPAKVVMSLNLRCTCLCANKTEMNITTGCGTWVWSGTIYDVLHEVHTHFEAGQEAGPSLVTSWASWASWASL